MDDTKLRVWLGCLAAGNILSLAFLTGLFFYITANLAVGPDGKPLPKEISSAVPESIKTMNDAEIIDGAKSGIYSLQITDNGFKPVGLNALAGKNFDLEVENKSSSPHVFQIKSLGIKAVTIAPGETQKFLIVSPLDLSETTGFVYKSTAAGTDNAFDGILLYTVSK